MYTVKRILRKATLYLFVVLFTGGMPLSFVSAAGNYTYDSSTGHWDSKNWVWDPAQGKYVHPVSTTTPSPSPSPSPSATPSNSPAPTTTPSASSSPTTTIAPQTTTTSPIGGGGGATINQNVTGNQTTNVNNGVNVTNGLTSGASTGSADVKKNTTAGDATSGDANAATTIVNSVHSTVGSGSTTGIAHFTENLYGNITGDITLGPTINSASIDQNANLSSANNVNNNDTLTNNQTLSATSGNAAVKGNTTGGSATSGNANTVANVLNLINTLVAANKSFEGTINIYGNLNGDILVSPDFIPQLLASNAQVVGTYTMPLSSTINDNNTIQNNVKLNATTGTATVKNNTAAGNATTGTATTNLTILNLTGHKVNAAKSLLVFVNVLGKWVGMIVDAPGATAAALGSGVISDNVSVTNTNSLNNNAKIINNLDLASASGNSTVAGNTQGGNATTGDATASANIANISTSEFNLSDWFGILYINVFGTWIGSFGIDTAAGTIVPLTGDAVPQPPAAVIGSPNLHFGFRSIPHTGTTILSSGGTGGGGGNIATSDPAYAAVLASANKTGGLSSDTSPALLPVASPNADPFGTIMMVTGLSLVGGSSLLWAVRRWLAFRAAAAF